jgi:hypothetical protein
MYKTNTKYIVIADDSALDVRKKATAADIGVIFLPSTSKEVLA